MKKNCELENKNSKIITNLFIKLKRTNPIIFHDFLFYCLTSFILNNYFRNTIRKILKCERFSNLLDILSEHLFLGLAIKLILKALTNKRMLHEPPISRFLKNKKGTVFVDIGANFGFYSFYLYNNFKYILAVEPHPKNAIVINTIKQKYGYKNVKIMRVAINDTNGTIKLYIGSHHNAHSILAHKPWNNIQNKSTLTIKAIKLDSLLKSINKVDLIKVDVQGAEWRVLAGAKKSMKKVRAWLIELHDKSRKNELENLMKSYSYKMKWFKVPNHRKIHLYAERN